MHALFLLGPPRLTTPVATLRLERRPAAVCAWLAIEGPTSRQRLAGLLWPDSGDVAARANLRQLLRRLRTAGADVVEGGSVLALRSDLSVDVLRGSAVDLPPVLEGADRGDLLEGCDYDDAPDLADWLAAAREDLQRLRLRALDSEADRLERAGALAQALPLAQASVRLEPYAEAAQRRLMRLLHLLGDRAGALAAFQRCRQRLAEELGTAPAAETLALARQIERGGAAPAAVPPAEAVPLAMLRPPRLVGRAQAWAAMEAAWRQGQLIAVSGPAGTGKTRLIEDFAATKGPTLRIEGRPGDALVPYASLARNQRKVLALRPALRPSARDGPPRWVWQEAARLTPELDVPSPAAAGPDKLRFFDGLMALYVHGIRGLAALVVDDLHFYDDASIEQSVYAIARTVPLGAGMPHHLVAFREDELPARLRVALEEMVARGHAAWIRLGPLDDDAMAELLHSLLPQADPALAGALSRYTGGNPLFALETVRLLHQTGQLDGAVPARLPLAGRVRELIERRLHKLSDAAQLLARAAAVLRSDYDFELLCEVVGRPPFELAAAWAELEAAQVMAGQRFSHDLVFEAVQAGLPEALGGWLHRAAAAALERRGAGPARVAPHWLDGGDAGRATRAWLAAAEQAWRDGLVDDARGLWQQAARQAPDDALRQVAEAGLRRAQVAPSSR